MSCRGRVVSRGGGGGRNNSLGSLLHCLIVSVQSGGGATHSVVALETGAAGRTAVPLTGEPPPSGERVFMTQLPEVSENVSERQRKVCSERGGCGGKDRLAGVSFIHSFLGETETRVRSALFVKRLVQATGN